MAPDDQYPLALTHDDDGNVLYLVFHDKKDRTSRVHTATCGYVGQSGGFSNDSPPNTWYSGPVKGLANAEWLTLRYSEKVDWDSTRCPDCI